MVATTGSDSTERTSIVNAYCQASPYFLVPLDFFDDEDEDEDEDDEGCDCYDLIAKDVSLMICSV